MLPLILAFVLPGHIVLWTESTHPEFADGVIDPQMYVSLRAQQEPDSGCVEFFSRFDVDNNGFYDLACSEDSGPNLMLYLGTDSGYSPANRLEYQVGSGGNVDLADLNLDGHSELIHSGWRDGRAVIYWGTPFGPSSTETTALAYTGQGEDVNVYDLDKDAYLDIIVGSSNGRLYIFWGGPAGYSSANCTEVNLGYSIGHNTEIADFDKDGWGDIAVSMWTYNENPIVYWGPNRSPREIVWLPGRWNNFHGISVADLDKDDWLDIVYTGYDTVVTAFVYFGSDSGFLTDRRTEIHPGMCYGGSAVMDFNDDSWLDIVFMRGNWIHGGTWKPAIYLNTQGGSYFSDASRTDLGEYNYNSSGGFIGDFDFDHIQDIFINNMVNGDSSYILWGPEYTRRTGLPADQDHHGVFREPGNVYDRSLTAFYTSSVFDAGPDSSIVAGTSAWVGFEPPGSSINVSYRTGNTPTPDSSWKRWGTVYASGCAIPDSCLDGRYIQYMVRFSYDRPCFLPMLEELQSRLTVGPEVVYDVGVEAILAPAGTVDSGVSIVPRAVVRNYGDRPATFPVHFRIGTGHTDDMEVTLSPGTADTVEFAAWVARPRGLFAVSCSTAYVNDTNPANDFMATTVTVRVRDVGTVRVVAPRGTMLSGDTVTPRAVVRNHGTTTQPFFAVMRIGSYADTTQVAGLAPDSQRTVLFRRWDAVAGTLVVSCSTTLATDANRRNDKATDSVEVTFTPPVDVGVEAILAPAGPVDSGTAVVPTAVVRNFGTGTVSFPVRFAIGGFYTDACTLSLAGGAVDTVGFAPWTARQRGPQVTQCTTACPDDTNPANDVRTGLVTVQVRDVGTAQVIAPRSSMPVGDSVRPRAVVCNYGTSSEDFFAVFRIGSGYTDTAYAAGLLPGTEQVLAFRQWIAQEGTHAVSCSTLLATDMNLLNDKATDSVRGIVGSRYDVGVEAILAPAGDLDSGTMTTPAAIVRNFGTQPATFPVRFYIGGFYLAESIVAVRNGESDTVRFPTWRAAPRGQHMVRCTTAYANDSNPANDRCLGTTTVTVGDVGAVRILAPARNQHYGDTIVPQAVVTNFGNTVESFSVILRIGRGYSETGMVTGLEPDSSVTVSFPAWPAGSGDFAVSCSTTLATDMHPENDKVNDSTSVAVRWVVVEPDTAASVDPALYVDYRLRATNMGNLPDTIDLITHGSDSGWSTVLLDASKQNLLPDHNGNGLPDIAGLGSGATENFTVRVTAPANALAGVVDTMLVTGRSSRDTTATDDARLTTDVLAAAALRISPDQYDSVAAGGHRDYEFKVENSGNVADLADLEVRRVSSGYGWHYELRGANGARLGDGNRNGRPDVGPMVPFDGIGDLILRVTVPEDAQPGDIDSVQLWALSGTNPGVASYVTVRTRALGRLTLLVVDPDQEDQQLSGTTSTYRLYVQTVGNAPDIINLKAHVGQPDWGVSLWNAAGSSRLPDVDEDDRAELGPVTAGEQSDFTLLVRAPDNVPEDLSGSIDSLGLCRITVVGQSALFPNLVDSAVVAIRAIPRLAIHNFRNPFRGQTRFIFSVPQSGRASLYVYNRAGEIVAKPIDNEQFEIGIYARAWNATNLRGRKLAPGTYLYRYELTETKDHLERELVKKLMIE